MMSYRKACMIFVIFSYTLLMSSNLLAAQSFSNASTNRMFYDKDECELNTVESCLPYEPGWIHLPNIIGHKRQQEITNSSELRFLHELESMTIADMLNTSYSPKEMRDCYVQVHQLFCGLLTPKCYFVDHVRTDFVAPCRDFCLETLSRCRPMLNDFVVNWPQTSHCDLLPERRSCSSFNNPPGNKRMKNLRRRRRKKQGKSRRKHPRVVHFVHHSFAAMKRSLRKVSRICPDIMRVYTIGRSVEKRRLLVVEITDNPGVHELLEPEMKWVGGIHGNEVVGREVLIAFVKYLCQEWLAGNDRIRRLIRNTRIHILPNMNPDGYYRASTQRPNYRDWLTGRTSARNFDLNRSFPNLNREMYLRERNGGKSHHIPIPSSFFRRHSQRQLPEVYAVIQWLTSYPFVLSAQLHGGALLANYPYDASRKTKWNSLRVPKPEYTACPDDEVFQLLSSAYAENHSTMANVSTNQCNPKQALNGGITNGAAWYSLRGGMQDFNYLHTNCFEITVELGCVKFPRGKQLPKEWQRNKEALLAFTEKAHIGIKGLVMDREGVAIEDAVIHVAGIDHDVTTTNRGEYWRLLVPSWYHVTASHPDCRSRTKRVRVVAGNKATVTNFTLIRLRNEE